MAYVAAIDRFLAGRKMRVERFTRSMHRLLRLRRLLRMWYINTLNHKRPYNKFLYVPRCRGCLCAVLLSGRRFVVRLWKRLVPRIH